MNTEKQVDDLIEIIKTNANDHFGNSMGSGDFYAIRCSNFIYTDGVKELCEKCESWWFMDVILSYQGMPKVLAEEFQCWKLYKVKDCKYKVTMDDGNDNIVIMQTIPFSDFPYDMATIWLEYNTLMLPKER